MPSCLHHVIPTCLSAAPLSLAAGPRLALYHAHPLALRHAPSAWFTSCPPACLLHLVLMLLPAAPSINACSWTRTCGISRQSYRLPVTVLLEEPGPRAAAAAAALRTLRTAAAAAATRGPLQKRAKLGGRASSRLMQAAC